MNRVFMHPLAGVLSAYGMGLADVRSLRERALELPLRERSMFELSQALDELATSTSDILVDQGIPVSSISVVRRTHLRYDGTDTSLEIEFGSLTQMRERFEAAYRQRYGFVMADKQLVIEAAAVEAIGKMDDADVSVTHPPRSSDKPKVLARVLAFMDGQERQTNVYDRELLQAGGLVSGPAIIREQTGTTVVEPGWQAEVDTQSNLIMTRTVALDRQFAIGTECDPVMLEVFNNLFMSIAEQMGLTLEKTAYSVNIKERLDFSCAIFDPDGDLVANAPHIPIHLGSMSEAVRTIIDVNATSISPGDVYVVNAPYNGGTHLPDITVITPVFNQARSRILFYVASRGHHADIGGITPGSMPPDSRVVEEEGILFDNFKLVDQGTFLEQELRDHLGSGPYPARNPEQNIADLKAQIAAGEKGVQEVHRMIDQFGVDVVHAYMKHVQDNAEEQVRRVIDLMDDGEFSYSLDEGSIIKVKITFDKENRCATVDFTGTSNQRPSNFNAPSAVVRSAVLYVFRCLVDDAIPLNEGCLKPINIIIPKGCMLAPQYPAAVVAGNVETSQAVTDTLFGALRLFAASQGTMNNLTFGNAQHQYYETVCGGAGAGPGFDGTSAIHTHMTNTRLTDPEILEWRHPVVLEDFRIRRNSGGYGQFRGGDGTLRRIRFQEPMEVVMLSNHRIIPPYGMAGGHVGEVGRNWIERADGEIDEMTGRDKRNVDPGDVFVLQTPTGGGYGKPE